MSFLSEIKAKVNKLEELTHSRGLSFDSKVQETIIDMQGRLPNIEKLYQITSSKNVTHSRSKLINRGFPSLKKRGNFDPKVNRLNKEMTCIADRLNQ